MIADVVNRYYEFRKYQEPDSEEALLFLISELGELCEAFVEVYEPVLPMRSLIYNTMVSLGKAADEIVSHREGWVRNQDRKKAVNVIDEIGDVLMMLIKFAEKIGTDPFVAMADKMRKKGFYSE